MRKQIIIMHDRQFIGALFCAFSGGKVRAMSFNDAIFISLPSPWLATTPRAGAEINPRLISSTRIHTSNAFT